MSQRYSFWHTLYLHSWNEDVVGGRSWYIETWLCSISIMLLSSSSWLSFQPLMEAACRGWRASGNEKITIPLQTNLRNHRNHPHGRQNILPPENEPTKPPKPPTHRSPLKKICDSRNNLRNLRNPMRMPGGWLWPEIIPRLARAVAPMQACAVQLRDRIFKRRRATHLACLSEMGTLLP